MSLESAFPQHLRCIASLLSREDHVVTLPFRRSPDLALTESVRTALMLGRIECIFERARAEMAHLYSYEEVTLLLQPEYFASPWYSIAACIGSDTPIPELDEPAPLDGLLAKLRARSLVHRIAFAEVLEAAWYGRRLDEPSLRGVFAVYGMPLKGQPL